MLRTSVRPPSNYDRPPRADGLRFCLLHFQPSWAALISAAALIYLFLCQVPTAAGQTLYGIEGPGNGQLVTFDPSSNAFTTVATLAIPAVTGGGALDAAGHRYYFSGSSGLYYVDTVTGGISGPFPTDGDFFSLDFDEASQILYGIELLNSEEQFAIVAFDPSKSVFTTIATFPPSNGVTPAPAVEDGLLGAPVSNSISIAGVLDATGHRYYFSGSPCTSSGCQYGLYYVDTLTGDLSARYPTNEFFVSLAFDQASQRLYGMEYAASGQPALVTLDPSSGIFTTIATLASPNSIGGAGALDSAGHRYYFLGGLCGNLSCQYGLYYVDTLTGDLSGPFPTGPLYSLQVSTPPTSYYGTIQVTTNLPAATFSIAGPGSYTGSGASFSQTNAPTGTYTITFGPVTGYTAPSQETQTLTADGTITFVGTYVSVPATPPAAMVTTSNLLSPATLSFGVALVPISPLPGGTSTGSALEQAGEQSLQIINTGGSSLIFPSDAFSFTSNDFLTDSTPADACLAGTALAPNSTCKLYVRFAPTGTANRSGSLSISSNDPSGPQTIQLTGVGMPYYNQCDLEDGVPQTYDGGQVTCGYGCALMSATSILATFTEYSASTPTSVNALALSEGIYSFDKPDGLTDLLDLESLPGSIFAPDPTLQTALLDDPTYLNQYLEDHIVTAQERAILKFSMTGSVVSGSGQCAAGTHYVAVVGPELNGDWQISDSGWGNVWVVGANAYNGSDPNSTNATPLALFSLNAHLNPMGFDAKNSAGTLVCHHTFSIENVVLYNAPVVSTSLEFKALSPVELLVTDSQGRQLGNISPGVDVAYIPQSAYFRDYPIADDTGDGPAIGEVDGIKTAYLSNPTGSYGLQTTGTSPGTFIISSRAVASDGSIHSSSFSGVTNAGSIASYQFQYAGLPGTAPQLSLLPSSEGSVPPSQIATTASGLIYSRVSQTFNGTVTIKNISSTVISGPFQIVFTGMPANVTLANATNYSAGMPYQTVPGIVTLAPGQSATVSVQFKNPSNLEISLTPVIYSGTLD